MKRITGRLLIILFLFGATAATGNIYSWKDKDGNMHFSNMPPNPEEDTNDLQVSDEIKYNAVQDQARTERLRNESSQKAALANRNKSKVKKRNNKKRDVSFNGEVVLFSTVNCYYCVKAKAFLNKHNVSYTNIDINKSTSGRKRFKKLNGRGVPMILVGDKVIRGFNKTALKNALGL